MASRKTAVRVTESAAIAEREGIENTAARALKAVERLDAAAARDVATMTTAEWLRRARHRSTDAERCRALIRRCKDAARLELRGESFDAEDRLDAASEVLLKLLERDPAVALPLPSAALASARDWRAGKRGRPTDVLAFIGDQLDADADPPLVVVPPDADDRRASLRVCCDHVKHIRRRIQTDRERDHAEYLRRQSERGDDGFTAAERAAIEDRAIRAANDAATAELESRRIARKLECDSTGPVADVLYQWLRDAAGPVCADERGYTAGSWRVRVSTGGKLLRAALPGPMTLLDAVLPDGAIVIGGDVLTYALRDDSREAGHRTRQLADIGTHWREGTDAGKRPVRPTDETQARLLCRAVRWQRAAPVAAETRRKRAHAPERVRMTDDAGKVTHTRYVTRDALTRQADAHRAVARDAARIARRERAVPPPARAA